MSETLVAERCDTVNQEKLAALGNQKVLEFAGKYIAICNPDSVFVVSDSAEDLDYIKKQAVLKGEESVLATNGHTYHFDGMKDQGRDKANTKYLMSEGLKLSSHVNTVDKAAGTQEIEGFLKDSMVGKEMIVAVFCLGPIDSEFSIPCIQITDSNYVIHSESILYRNGYNYLKNNSQKEFFKFVHTAGELENNVCKSVENRRVYIDLKEDTVFSTNTQYAGNCVGLKKLAMRLAIQKASKEGWLTEHMFIMNVKDKAGKDTYFTGAFPSACGKTSTSMLQGEAIVGDDIAYIRKRDGKAYTANVEAGIFGIIENVNASGDPAIFDALTQPGEVIFSNILVGEDNNPYWLGDDRDIPASGTNYSGQWTPEKTDANGNKITHSHKNARYTVSISKLANRDSKADDPNGVEISGMIYGGRDSDTSVPVEEALSWQQGIIAKGASIESETTAATIGQSGVRVFNPMSNMDFLSITLGKYIQNNLDFSKDLNHVPSIFSVNYFLKGQDGKYLNGMKDKHIWLKWMGLRVNDEVKAIPTPSGFIPYYEDLKPLFSEVLDKEYTQEEYIEQFTYRIPENLTKVDRVIAAYKKEGGDIPTVVFEELEAQKQRLLDAQAKYGDYVSPLDFTV